MTSHVYVSQWKGFWNYSNAIKCPTPQASPPKYWMRCRAFSLGITGHHWASLGATGHCGNRWFGRMVTFLYV